MACPFGRPSGIRTSGEFANQSVEKIWRRAGGDRGTESRYVRACVLAILSLLDVGDVPAKLDIPGGGTMGVWALLRLGGRLRSMWGCFLRLVRCGDRSWGGRRMVS